MAEQGRALGLIVFWLEILPKALPGESDFGSAFLNLRGLRTMWGFCHILVLCMLWFTE